MSSSKPRARRNRAERKEFIEKEEDNENVIGVQDEQFKTKIQEKQEDMFDPHQLRQNIFQDTQSKPNNPFIQFEDDIEIKEQQPTSTLTQTKKEEESARKQRKRDRPKRELKKYDSGEEDNHKQQKQLKQEQSIFQGNEILEDEDNKKTESELKREEEERAREEEKRAREEEEEERLQAEKMKKMVSKKAATSIDNYVLMHALLNKVGNSKEERIAVIYTPLAPNQQSFVYFKRYQSGFSEYYQVLGQDQRPIFFCQNQRGCIGCNYYISLTKEMDKNNPSYLGKLRGNAAGSIYQLYDRGIQPSNDQEDRSKFRVTMASIQYQSNFLGMKGPRKFKATVPKINKPQDLDDFKFLEDQTLNQYIGPNVARLRNKQPRWNQRLKSYALNFGGRVKQASIKNFILTDERYDVQQEDKAPNVIVFGKIDENTFALEFGHPLSLYQGFGIAMSEFDFKLKCE